jgi:DNA-binding NarL/FixJ family response regulator
MDRRAFVKSSTAAGLAAALSAPDVQPQLPPAAQRIRVLLCDDDSVLAEAVTVLIERGGTDDQPRQLAAEGKFFQVCGVVGDGVVLVEATDRLRPDIIVTNFTIPRLNWLDAIRQIRARGNPVPIVILTMHNAFTLTAIAFRDGASFVLMHSAGGELIVAMLMALRGQIWGVTPRERQFLQLTAEGYSLGQIAYILTLDRRTVACLKYRLMRTLRVHSTAELIACAARLGLIGLPLSCPRKSRHS